ncbi:MAG: proline--tRNA ligase [archaeon]
MADEGFFMEKEKNFSEWYNEILRKAELIDQRYNIKGFIVHQPNAAITEKIIYRIYEEELEKKGHLPTRFPALIPEDNFEIEKKHAEGFKPGVFWVTQGADTKFTTKYALRPTSETAMYRMFSFWIRSWKDMPLKVYQSCQVWRYETKATKPLIRDREFYWIEAHCAFATKEEAERQVFEDMETTRKVLYEKLGIPFLFFRRPEWDKFAGAEYTFGTDTLLSDGYVFQLPSTHFLGQRFAKAFNVQFLNKNDEKEYAWQTCYGPGISRIFAALISIHGDDRGLVFPFELAPTQVVIIPILGKENEKVLEKCRELETKLKEKYRVVLDLSEKQPGEKFYYWETRGTSVRIEIGAKEVAEDSLTVFRRDLFKKEKIKSSEIEKYLEFVEKDSLEILRKRAEEKFKSRLFEAKSLEELKEKIKNGGIGRVMFCSVNMDGENCADILKAETGGAEVRGTLLEEEKAEGNCIVCGKPAKYVVYVAKSY